MKILNKKELKIFLSLLLIYTVFAGFGGWNESSLMSLTFSMGFENKIEINNFVNHPLLFTIDRTYDGENWYSPNAPGMPFLGTLIVKISRQFLGSDILSITWKIHTLFLLLIIFISGIGSAGTSILIYKISRYFTKNEKIRILLAFTYGLGTMAFLYGIRYRSHAITAFLSFLCFYLIFKSKKENTISLKHSLIAGLAGGWVVITDFPSTIIIVVCFILLLSLKNKNKYQNILFFLLGSSVPLVLLLIYNYLIFGNIFSIAYFPYNFHSPLWPIKNIHPLIGLLIFIKRLILNLDLKYLYFLKDSIFICIRNMIQLLFLSYRGLFIYSPILFLSLLGFKKLYKKYKIETILLAVSWLIILIFVSGWHSWWCHGGAGCRRFLPFIPFLFIPLIYAIKKINFKIVITIAFLSIFLNLLTIQSYEYLGGYPYGIKETTYRFTVIQFFDNVANPLVGHYWPLFLEFGPKSNLIERIFDISLLPFLNLIFVGLILCLIWIKAVKKFYFKHKKIVFSVIVIIILLLSMRIIFNDEIDRYAKKQYINYYLDRPIERNLEINEKLSIFYPGYYYQKYKDEIKFNIPYILKLDGSIKSINMENKNWYIPRTFPATKNNQTSMFNNANINLYLSENKSKSFILEIALSSYYKDRKLQLLQNGRLIETYNIPTSEIEINQTIIFKPGMNELRFISTNGCDYVYKVRKKSSTNLQCISFTFYKLRVYESDINND